MIEPMPPASPGPPTADAPFETLPAVGSVELDRYCPSCGYNLMRQAVRREPRTALLLVRCPECGDYEPANTLTTAHRSWFRGLAVLGWVLWVVSWLGMVFAAVMSMAALLPDAAWQRHDYIQAIGSRYYGDSIKLGPMDSEMWLITAIVFGSFMLTAIFLTTITTAFMPHWKRWGYFIFAQGWPIIALGLAMAIFIPERVRWRGYNNTVEADFTAWIYQYTIACVLLTALTGLAFAWLGRPFARLLVCLFVPPRQRGIFAYLWIVDQKEPPTTATKPGQSAAPARVVA